jgi:hypothetical protein
MVVRDTLHELVDALPETQVGTAKTFLEFLIEKQRNGDNNDLEILNENAERLNEEAEDVLSYQVGL